MLWSTVLFSLFALLSGTGAYLILAHHRGRGAGLLGAFLTLLFFAALYAGVIALFHAGGLS
jgi:hypothetical protein